MYDRLSSHDCRVDFDICVVILWDQYRPFFFRLLKNIYKVTEKSCFNLLAELRRDGSFPLVLFDGINTASDNEYSGVSLAMTRLPKSVP